MAMRFDDDIITLSGSCGVEEVEELLALVGEHPHRLVDIENATWIHTALWQVLFMKRSTVRGGSEGSFASRYLIPNIRL